MRRASLSLAAMLLAGVIAGAVWAAAGSRIVGGPKNDLIRGTRNADVLEGRAGNDRLFGLAGKDVLIGGPGRDLLVGGPGKDTLRCGRGNDTAKADAADHVAIDCEIVTGLPEEEPEPQPEPSPSPSQKALPGRYCGFTNGGHGICVTVAPNSSRVTAYTLGGIVDCGSSMRTIGFAAAGPDPIQTDLKFFKTHEGSLPDRATLKNIMVSFEVSGTFDTAGNVSGSFWLKRLTFDSGGSHFDCTSNPTTWQAKLGA